MCPLQPKSRGIVYAVIMYVFPNISFPAFEKGIHEAVPRGHVEPAPVDWNCGQAEQRIGGSADQRISGSADQRISGSADQRISGSADQRISADQRTSGSADQRISGSADQRISGPADQRISGPADQRISGSADQRISGSADQRTSGSADQRISGSADRGISGSADQRISGSDNPAAISHCFRNLGSSRCNRLGSHHGRLAPPAYLPSGHSSYNCPEGLDLSPDPRVCRRQCR